MNRVMFFNYNPMGLGGLWQQISWLLTHQKEELDIHLHLDEWNTKRFKEIFGCFSKSRFPVRMHEKSILDYDDSIAPTWRETTEIIIKDILSRTDYKRHEIMTVGCNLKHSYWPVRFDRRSHSSQVSLYLEYENENPEQPRPEKYNLNRKLLPGQSLKIKDILQKNGVKYVELGPKMTLKENCEEILKSFFVLGREGGWTHVSHSCKVDYYPLVHHEFLDGCHGSENCYLKKVIPVDHIGNLLFKRLPKIFG